MASIKINYGAFDRALSLYKGSKSHIRQPLKKTEKDRIIWRQKGKCKKCGIIFAEHKIPIHFDHIRPVRKGGKKGKDLKNIQALCPNCHAKKTHKEEMKTGKRKQTNPLW